MTKIETEHFETCRYCEKMNEQGIKQHLLAEFKHMYNNAYRDYGRDKWTDGFKFGLEKVIEFIKGELHET